MGFSPKPRNDAYCLRLNFNNISKLGYYSNYSTSEGFAFTVRSVSFAEAFWARKYTSFP